MAGLPLQEDVEVEYCGTLDIVVPEGTPDIGAVANGISIPILCFPDPPNETFETRMMRWVDESRSWVMSEPNPGNDNLYPLSQWPRMPLRIADIVRQLNIHYRRPGQEFTHRSNGWLSDPPISSRPLTQGVASSTTSFNVGSAAATHFIPGHYALVGNEVVLVTDASGGQIVVQRGRLGTTPTSHPAGRPVRYDRYCNPHHDYVVEQAWIIGGLRGSRYARSRWTYFPGATPVGSAANWDPIIEDEDGEFESRGFVIFVQDNANPTTLDGGEVIIHLTPMQTLWPW